MWIWWFWDFQSVIFLDKLWIFAPVRILVSFQKVWNTSSVLPNQSCSIFSSLADFLLYSCRGSGAAEVPFNILGGDYTSVVFHGKLGRVKDFFIAYIAKQLFFVLIQSSRVQAGKKIFFLRQNVYFVIGKKTYGMRQLKHLTQVRWNGFRSQAIT